MNQYFVSYYSHRSAHHCAHLRRQPGSMICYGDNVYFYTQESIVFRLFVVAASDRFKGSPFRMYV